MNIGITGGSGFIGRYLLNKLREQHLVTSVIRGKSGHSDDITVSDYSDVDNLSSFLKKSDVLIHLANANRPRDLPHSLAHDIESNLLKTIRLFEAYYQSRPDGHIIFFSTGGALYKSNLSLRPFTETDPVDPISSYGNQKLISENLLRLICSQTKASATVLRVSNPYGVCLSSERTQGIIGVAASCVVNGKPFKLFGRTDVVRDYIHLADVARAIESILIHDLNMGFRVFNLGSGIGHTTNEVLQLISKVSEKYLDLKIEPPNTSELPWSVLNISKFKNTFAWHPTLDLEAGLTELFNLERSKAYK